MDSWINYLFIIALIVSFIVNKNNWCDDKGYCQRNQCNRLFNRDLIYCFIIFVLFGIVILTWKLGTQDEIAKQLSFAGTVTSIILSVLAIFITMLSEMKSSVSKTKMDNLVSKIEEISAQTDNQVVKNEEMFQKTIKLVDDNKDVNEAIASNITIYKNLIEKQDKMLIEMSNLSRMMKEMHYAVVKTENLKNRQNKNWDKNKIKSEEYVNGRK